LWLDTLTNSVRALPELDDGEYCINCGVQELRTAAGHRQWRRLAVVSINEGALEMLEDWPVCPNCETSQGAKLVQYVRLALT
jgi:hypothetical protein